MLFVAFLPLCSVVGSVALFVCSAFAFGSVVPVLFRRPAAGLTPGLIPGSSVLSVAAKARSRDVGGSDGGLVCLLLLFALVCRLGAGAGAGWLARCWLAGDCWLKDAATSSSLKAPGKREQEKWKEQ